jgi:hypothetical protein
MPPPYGQIVCPRPLPLITSSTPVGRSLLTPIQRACEPPSSIHPPNTSLLHHPRSVSNHDQHNINNYRQRQQSIVQCSYAADGRDRANNPILAPIALSSCNATSNTPSQWAVLANKEANTFSNPQITSQHEPVRLPLLPVSNQSQSHKDYAQAMVQPAASLQSRNANLKPSSLGGEASQEGDHNIQCGNPPIAKQSNLHHPDSSNSTNGRRIIWLTWQM